MASNLGIDLYAPNEIAEKIENIGIIKAALSLRTMTMLGVPAGAFISFGALYFTLVASDASLGFASTRVPGGSGVLSRAHARRRGRCRAL